MKTRGLRYLLPDLQGVVLYRPCLQLKNKQSNLNALRLSDAFSRKEGIIGIELLAFPTSCSLWKTTTLPPLSPVANSSPDELNSTVEIMSAAKQEAE